jgi:hypothetical protein
LVHPNEFVIYGPAIVMQKHTQGIFTVALLLAALLDGAEE